MITQSLDVREILAQNQAARLFQGIASALWFYQGVAVAVSADPGAQANQVGQSVFAELESVNILKRIYDLGVDFRQSIEQRKAEITQANADFIFNRGLFQADFIGLP